ncbi:MAG: class II aldolase/adducin family protein [Thermoplasmatota archaeon]
MVFTAPSILEIPITDIQKTAAALVGRSWAESFFGNISVLLDLDDVEMDIMDRYPIHTEIPDLNRRYILVTRTFSTMKEVVRDPERALGFYRIENRELLLLWGEGPPTSELSSHLMAYSTGRGRAIIHCHMDLVGRVSSSFGIADHPLPTGTQIIEELEPGSIELARATGDALRKNDTVIWRGHGAFSMTDSLGESLKRLEGLEGYLNGIPP